MKARTYIIERQEGNYEQIESFHSSRIALRPSFGYQANYKCNRYLDAFTKELISQATIKKNKEKIN